jgi:hypothetical protein
MSTFLKIPSSDLVTFALVMDGDINAKDFPKKKDNSSLE